MVYYKHIDKPLMVNNFNQNNIKFNNNNYRYFINFNEGNVDIYFPQPVFIKNF